MASSAKARLVKWRPHKYLLEGEVQARTIIEGAVTYRANVVIQRVQSSSMVEVRIKKATGK